MKTFYYTDELNDDFAQTNVNCRELDPAHNYIPTNPFRKALDFLLYRLIATPVAFLYQKLKFGEKIIDRKKLKPYRKTGYFLYGNHTRLAGDAFTPTLVTFPKKAFIISNPDSVSIPVLGFLPETLGCLPLPTSRKGIPNFKQAISTLAKSGKVVTVYPEAHVWPYYTKIRPFKDVSFRYPAETGKPVFTFTVTYHKRKFFKTPKTVVYVDGPFFPDQKLTVKENQKRLRELAFNAMKERSELSTHQAILYIKKENV